MEISNDIKLPAKIPINVAIKEVEDREQEGAVLLKEIAQYIETSSFNWIRDEVFRFTLPRTIFTTRSIIHFNAYENFELDYLTNNTSLDSQQLSQIWKRGQFEVKSRIENLPYVWKMSLWTVKGYENIKDSLCDDLSRSFYFLYKLKDRFTLTDYQDYVFSIPSSFYSIYLGIWYTLDLLLGLPSYDEINQIESVSNEIKKECLLDFILNHPEIKLQIYTSFQREFFRQLDALFSSQWEKQELLLEQDYFDKEMTPNEIKIKLREDKEKAFIEFIEKKSDIPDEKIKYLVTLILALRIVKQHQFQLQATIQNERDRLHREIQMDNYIKSRITEWLDNEVSQRMASIIEEKKNATNKTIEQELQCYPVPLAFWIFSSFYQDCLTIKLQERIKKRSKVYSYSQDIQIPCKCVPRVKSSFPLWRIWLYIAMYWAMTKHVMIFLLSNAFNSSFGLLALFCLDVNTYSYTHSNGCVVDGRACITYPRALGNLFTWISDSRREFEDSADTGLFGKWFSRIFNLIWNYVFKLLICGPIILLLYPCLILLWTCTFFALGLTSPIWMIFVILVVILFLILCYDFYTSFISCAIFPIVIYIVWYILLKGIFQLLFIIIAVISQPILSIFMLCFAITRFIVRFLYDCLLFLFVKCLAKVPKSDTAIAWKISGPGLFRQRYNHISLPDAITMVHARIEKIQLETFRSQVLALLKEPRQLVMTKVVKLFEKVNIEYSIDDTITSNISFYENLLGSQISEREQLFPRASNIKYSAGELELLKNMAREYIMELVEMNNMIYIWELFGLAPESWTRLTDAILSREFGNQILETLDENDFRVEMKRNMNSEFEEISRRILENPRLERFKVVEKVERKDDVKIPEFANFSCLLSGSSIFNIDVSILNKQDRINLVGEE